jgi:hypothetical protein
MDAACHANPKYHTISQSIIRISLVRIHPKERRIMTQANGLNPAPENPESVSKDNLAQADKPAWSTPTLTRLEGRETQGIVPHAPGRAAQKHAPEEMIFFGS